MKLHKQKSYKIILFDGVCNFCNFWVNFVMDNDPDKKYKFASLQSAKGQELLHRFNLPTNSFDTLVLIDGETLYTKSTAALRIAKDLDSFIKYLSYFRFLPVWIRDKVYDLIAKNRYSFFGKRDACRIPTSEEKERFLEE